LIANKLYSIKIIPPRTEKRLAKKKRIEKKQFFLADIHYVLNTMVWEFCMYFIFFAFFVHSVLSFWIGHTSIYTTDIPRNVFIIIKNMKIFTIGWQQQNAMNTVKGVAT